MAKPDQTLRVVLNRGADTRALLNIWRSGEDFFSTIPGKQGHRSYHERGRTHTKTRVNGKDVYHDIKETDNPPRALRGSAPMHLLALRNERNWHGKNSPFIRYTGKRADVLIEIDALSIPPGQVINILAGLVEKGRGDLIDQHANELCSDGNLELARGVIDTPWPTIFCIVVHETAEAHMQWALRNPQRSLFLNQPSAAGQIRRYTVTPQRSFAWAAAGGWVYEGGEMTIFTTRRIIQGPVLVYRNWPGAMRT